MWNRPIISSLKLAFPTADGSMAAGSSTECAMTVDYFIRRYESDRAGYVTQLNFLESRDRAVSTGRQDLTPDLISGVKRLISDLDRILIILRTAQSENRSQS
jgi:hypothetical protein